MIRGISGGQKKRVTTAEMVAGPKKTLFMVSYLPSGRHLDSLHCLVDSLALSGLVDSLALRTACSAVAVVSFQQALVCF